MYHVRINRSSDSARVTDRHINELIAALVVTLKDPAKYRVREKGILFEVVSRSPFDILPTDIVVAIETRSLPRFVGDVEGAARDIAQELERTLPEDMTEGKRPLVPYVTVKLSEVGASYEL